MNDRKSDEQRKNHQDVSPQALSVARTLDRVCRQPGLYTLTVEIPAHRRKPWRVRLARMELLRDTTTPSRRSRRGRGDEGNE